MQIGEHRTMTKTKAYIAIDLKSFYASVECKERNRDPLTTNLVVADQSRTEKTICLAVSPSLKSYGIPGRPRLFEVVQKIKEVNNTRRWKALNRTFTGSSDDSTELNANPALKVDYIVAPPRMEYYLEYSSKIYNIYLKIYFPEYLTVYKKFDTTTGMMILEEVPLPTMVTALGVDNIIKIWREHKVRGKGASFNRAKTLVDAAHDSVGKSGGQGAVMEIQMLLEDYKVKKQQLEMVTSVMEELIMQIPNAEKMLSVDGVGLVTVAGFISEVGDISRFKNPKQIQKYAGFELVENSSGKHKGRTTISKRGRKKLRKIIYQVVLPLIQSNKEFRSIYDYYRKRIKNPLKGRQAMIAVGCKLIRVFFAIMTKGVVYNGSKMIEDIHRPTQLPQAA